MVSPLGVLDQIGFRGSRDYLHGTDLFQHVAARLPLVAPLSARFHSPIRKVPELFELSDRETTEGWPALFVMGLGPESRTIGLRETRMSPSHRFPYDESDVVTNAAIEGSSPVISSSASIKFTFIERAVALQKKLLNEVLAPDIKWWFVRLDLKFVPPITVGRLELKLTQHLGVRIAKSEICEGGRVLGDIYFSGEQT